MTYHPVFLSEYRLPDNIADFIAAGRARAERDTRNCRTWQEYVTALRGAHKIYADTSRHNPNKLLKPGEKNGRKLTPETRRVNFQTTMIALAEACYIACMLRRFPEQEEILVELRKGVEPRDPMDTDGVTPAKLIYADDFYLKHSGASGATPSFRIVKWLVAIMNDDENEKDKKYEGYFALKNGLFAPVPSVPAANETIQPVNDARPGWPPCAPPHAAEGPSFK